MLEQFTDSNALRADDYALPADDVRPPKPLVIQLDDNEETETDDS